MAKGLAFEWRVAFVLGVRFAKSLWEDLFSGVAPQSTSYVEKCKLELAAVRYGSGAHNKRCARAVECELLQSVELNPNTVFLPESNLNRDFQDVFKPEPEPYEKK